MSIGTFLPALLLLTSTFHGMVITGRLIGATGDASGGPDAYMVALVQSPKDVDKIDILGYTHPDEQGNWIIANLPASGKINLVGFYLRSRTSLSYKEVILDGSSAMNLGIQELVDFSIAMVPSQGSFLSSELRIPHLFVGKQNQEIADITLKLVLATPRAVPPSASSTAGVDGNWMRSGRVYKIADGKAAIVDAGTTLKTSVTVGDEVMRNIVKSGENTWQADVLWQLESEKKWATGMLSLSPDGNTLTRLSISPWGGPPESVVFLRKKD
jgi:hypothetical protein